MPPNKDDFRVVTAGEPAQRGDFRLFGQTGPFAHPDFLAVGGQPKPGGFPRPKETATPAPVTLAPATPIPVRVGPAVIHSPPIYYSPPLYTPRPYQGPPTFFPPAPLPMIYPGRQIGPGGFSSQPGSFSPSGGGVCST